MLFLIPYEKILYPIIKTSVNLNLTNSEESPTLSKAALLTIVDWVKKYHNRSAHIEIHEVEEISQRKSSSPNSSIRNDVIEELAETINKYGGSK